MPDAFPEPSRDRKITKKNREEEDERSEDEERGQKKKGDRRKTRTRTRTHTLSLSPQDVSANHSGKGGQKHTKPSVAW